MIKKYCEYCGKEYESLKSSNRKYCSGQCFRNAKKKKMPDCIVCKKPIKPGRAKYCSMACRTTDWTGKQRPQTWKIKNTKCESCGKEFTFGGRYAEKQHKNRFCGNKCAQVSKRKSIDYYWNEKNGVSSNAKWLEHRKHIFERDHRKCCFCGEEKHNLQAHHIIPRKYGGTHSMENILTACRHCHGSIDRIVSLLVEKNLKQKPERIILKFMGLMKVIKKNKET